MYICIYFFRCFFAWREKTSSTSNIPHLLQQEFFFVLQFCCILVQISSRETKIFHFVTSCGLSLGKISKIIVNNVWMKIRSLVLNVVQKMKSATISNPEEFPTDKFVFTKVYRLAFYFSSLFFPSRCVLGVSM